MSKVGNYILDVQEFVASFPEDTKETFILAQVFKNYGHFGQDIAREYIKEMNGEYAYEPDPIQI